jgi:hypothetical protein
VLILRINSIGLNYLPHPRRHMSRSPAPSASGPALSTPRAFMPMHLLESFRALAKSELGLPEKGGGGRGRARTLAVLSKQPF